VTFMRLCLPAVRHTLLWTVIMIMIMVMVMFLVFVTFAEKFLEHVGGRIERDGGGHETKTKGNNNQQALRSHGGGVTKLLKGCAFQRNA
jgi:hypothetical protein